MRNPHQFVINKGEKTLELNQLSDGEKCLLALVGDLARRLALANPNLENPVAGHGVVLIDEIELHLHPEWQRNIIPRLQATFPNIQFLLSTHSPQVLGEVQDMAIYQLQPAENGIRVTPHPTVYGKDSNRILEDVLGSVLRNREVKQQLSDLFEAITFGRWDEVRELHQHLIEQVGVDEPELVKADVLIRRLRSKG
jgi:predicted ATP-binding protein involved in virulence